MPVYSVYLTLLGKPSERLYTLGAVVLLTGFDDPYALTSHTCTGVYENSAVGIYYVVALIHVYG